MVKLKPIHRDPIFDSKIFSLKVNHNLPFPFKRDNVIFFGYARVALYEGLKILDFKEGENILVPNYICNVALAPMHCLNIKVKFYKIDIGLRPLWETIEEQIDNKTRALLVVNYFGFPNNLLTARQLCDKFKLFLIEDNAHGFLSKYNDKPLGSTGDISIFSFRKTLPLPNGAALLVNNRQLESKLSMPKYLNKKSKNIRFFIKASFTNLQSCFKFLGIDRIKKRDFYKERIENESEEYRLEKYFIQFSKFGYFLMKHLNYGYIASQRGANYMKWLNFFNNDSTNVRPIFPVLNSGIVPLFFPALIQDKRDEFIYKMRSYGIDCFPWPFLPKESKEDYLYKRVICIPVYPNFNPANFKDLFNEKNN